MGSLPKSEFQIIHDIVSYISKDGSPFSSWYTGITSDINSRLQNIHNVSTEVHLFISRKSHSAGIASNAASILIHQYGTDGECSGGDPNSIYVYSYKKGHSTNP
jgi:hypothetical protein